jgi:hypothetical protein
MHLGAILLVFFLVLLVLGPNFGLSLREGPQHSREGCDQRRRRRGTYRTETAYE